jgi:predicted dinucleotide-binding enzyme
LPIRKKGAGAKASTGTFADAAKFGEVLVLAVKGDADEEAVPLCGAGLKGKAVLDRTSPISASAPPKKGVLRFL